MSDESPFEFKLNISRYLSKLSKIYEHEGQGVLLSVLVNARPVVDEGVTRGGYDNDVFGHLLRLQIPRSLFNFGLKEASKIEDRIKEDLNKTAHLQNEFVNSVSLEVETRDDDWRKESGALLTAERTVSDFAAKRVWGNDDRFRLFLSHKAIFKKEAFDLKDRLSLMGITAFVAHVDIQPTEEWRDEIENALSSMEGLAALMTSDFHDSDWTDQEAGFAYARSVPIVPVRLGRDPYGFIGKFQAVSCTWENADIEIEKALIKHDRAFDCYVRALRTVPNWDAGNRIAGVLAGIKRLTETQIDELVKAYNETSELRGCFAFNGKFTRSYGEGLVAHLNRLSGRKFRFDLDHVIQVIP